MVKYNKYIIIIFILISVIIIPFGIKENKKLDLFEIESSEETKIYTNDFNITLSSKESYYLYDNNITNNYIKGYSSLKPNLQNLEFDGIWYPIYSYGKTNDCDYNLTYFKDRNVVFVDYFTTIEYIKNSLTIFEVPNISKMNFLFSGISLYVKDKEYSLGSFKTNELDLDTKQYYYNLDKNLGSYYDNSKVHFYLAFSLNDQKLIEVNMFDMRKDIANKDINIGINTIKDRDKNTIYTYVDTKYASVVGE